MPGIIVPRKTVGELQRLIENGEAEVDDRTVARTRSASRIGDMVLTSKLIDGTFPGLCARHPARQRQAAHGRQGGLRGRGRPRLDGVERTRPRREALAVAAARLLLSVTNPDSGSATEELEVDYDGDPLDIGFNSRYLLDIAAQIDGEKAVLKLADPGSPTLIQDARRRARSTS